MTTRADVYGYLNRQLGIHITEFPEVWVGWSQNIERIVSYREDSILVKYRLSYPIKYSYRGTEMEVDVNAWVENNMFNGRWTTIKISIPEFEKFYVNTPEGREQAERAGRKLMKEFNSIE